MIFSSYLIKNIFSTAGSLESVEALEEEGSTGNVDTSNTASSKKVEIRTLPLLTNSSEYDTLPFLYFLNYYINKTNTKIDEIICTLLTQDDAKKPIKISQIPCDIIIVILPDNNSTKHYEISLLKEFKQLVYDNRFTYKFIMLSTLIDNLNIQNKLSYCGVILKYNFEAQIVPCTVIGLFTSITK